MSNPSSTLPADALLAPNAAGLARAAELLRGGRLVVLPTETVYGIGLNLLSPTARADARAIKAAGGGAAGGGGNAQQAPWVLHVAQPEDVLSWAPGLSMIGRRLVLKSLPGPIAFQIKLSPADEAAARARLRDAADETIADGYLTIRCPDLSYTQQVLAEADVPIAIIGAGTPQQPGVFEPGEVPESLFAGEPAGDPTAASPPDPARPEPASPGKPGQSVAAVLDGGPTRYRRSSTVVRLQDDHFSVVRPGVIDERIVQKLADFLVLFVCSGNTCRSPMAAAIATRLLADRLGIQPSELPLRHIVVQSAGVHASRGMRAAREAVEAARMHGADLSSHLSQPATLDLLRRADVIYTMTDAHRQEVLDALPAAARKTHRLDPEGDIDDPIGAGLPIYEQVAGHLADVLHKRLSELQI